MSASAKSVQKKTKRRLRINPVTLLVYFAIIASVSGCLYSIVSTQSTISEKQKELAVLQEKADELEAQNEEYQRILSSDDVSAYMEMQAIDNMNYAYPNERRFYDTSRN